MIKIVEEERVVYSVVCAPGIKDSDGEILTAEEIRHAQQKFMEEYQHIDKDHDYARYSSFENVGNVVESYITENDTTKKALNGEELAIPAGSWIIGIKITNNDLLHKIKNGIYPGVSVTGVPAAAKSKTLIGDLGKGWKAKTVSIVQEPANPIALFFAIKEKGGNETMVDYKSFYETIITAIKQVSEEKEEIEEVVEKSTKTEEDNSKSTEEIAEKSCDDKKAEKADDKIEEDEIEKDEEVEKAKDFEKKVDEKADMMVSEDELESKIDEAIREKEAIDKMVKDLDARLSAIEETLNESDKSTEEVVDKKDKNEKIEEELSEKAEEEIEENKDNEEELSEKAEEDDKDKKIAELEAQIEELKNKSASKSKSLSINQDEVAEKQKSVSLYERLGRDCMGRKL